MLSRLAFRTGSFSPLLISELQNRASTCVVLRCYATDKHHVAPVKRAVPAVPQPSVAEVIARWDKANKKYFGPERDNVNFPTPRNALHSPPARLGFIPDTWFQLFYDKTGVTGPYVLGGGLITYMLSKEIWIVEHGFSHFMAFWFLVWIIVKKYGKTIGAYLDNVADSLDERHWKKPMTAALASSQACIEEMDKVIWREEGQKHLWESKRENVDLQLESVYRQRLSEAHQAVKKRLDYQLDIEHAQKTLQQQHMVQWIVNSVVQGITPQQEKDSLAKCIGDLKTLAAKTAHA